MIDNPVVTAILFTLLAAGGATLSFVVSSYLNNEFPIGTLTVNLVSSFALGLIVAAPDPWPTVLGIGAVGALSTWSAVANEAAEMTRTERGPLALGYLGLSVSSGVLAAWFGLQLGPILF